MSLSNRGSRRNSTCKRFSAVMTMVNSIPQCIVLDFHGVLKKRIKYIYIYIYDCDGMILGILVC